MNIRDRHNRKVSFDTREEQGDKIDKLAVMIGKLVTTDSGASRQFKPQIHQGRGRGQNRGHYDRLNYRYRLGSGERRQYRQDTGMPRYEQNYRRDNFRGIVRNFDRQNSRGEYRTNKVMTEAGTGLEKGHFPEAIVAIEIGVQAIAGPGQDQE